jgi:XTP/dITP diphosphohydrolase
MAAEFNQVLRWLKQRTMEVKPPKPEHEQFEHNDWSEEKMV